MSCVPIPDVPVPTLPEPLSIPIPEPPTVPELPELFCCKLPIPPIPPLPVKLGPIIVNSGVIAILNVYVARMQAYIHSIPNKCPLE